jgi:hypothetical protein
VTFDELKIRGNYVPGVSRCCGDGVFFADYMAKSIIIRNSDIQGMDKGIICPGGRLRPGAQSDDREFILPYSSIRRRRSTPCLVLARFGTRS